VSTRRFRENLETLYARGYRPVNMTDVVDRKLDLPAGLSPVVLVFDDASPGQFSYVERDGKLEIDPNSAVGMLMAMNRKHPDWSRKAVFCMLPAAQQGHAFFGEKGIKGQKSEWRFKKVQFLKEQGFELCNHTLYHANLGKQTDAKAQEFIARGDMAIDSAVPGYRVRTFALPLGVWPKNKASAWAGSWSDPKSGRTVRYQYDAVLEVAGGPTRSPHDPLFNPRSINRVEVFARELEKTLDQLDRSGNRYVSDGNPRTVARPAKPVASK
jgi:peptidoglycan/xylan/chitin deacetylase (PgdA/CDA1 family)